MLKKIFFICYLNLLCISLCAAAENDFYILRFKTADRVATPEVTMNRLKENFNKISILISQAYYINQQGDVGGEIQPEILSFAKEHHMKLMALVTNSGFDRKTAHEFLQNKALQSKAIQSLIKLAKENNLYGIQLDFEMIRIEDRDALSGFYIDTAKECHANQLKISFAVAPVVTDQGNSPFLKKVYEVWQGAYDLKKLGEEADFITVMSYNQHGTGTTPGTTAGYDWMEQVVKYALKFIPANKISLGIPAYSTYWRTGGNDQGKILVKADAVNYERAMTLIKENHGNILWDKRAKVNYSFFVQDWLNEYVFLEDNKSFIAKNSLVKKYKLRGISVFDLGDEDPRFWNHLK